MASRVVEILYSLKDFFTPGARKVVKGYDEIGDASDDTARRTESNQKRTESAIERTGTSLRRLRSVWLSLTAALSAFQVSRSFLQFTNEVDRLGKVSQRLGVTIDNLASLSFAAEQAGVSTQQFEKAVETLQRRTGEAAAGIGEGAAAFAAFGINAEEFAQLDLEQKLQQLAVAFNAIGSEEEALAALQKLVEAEGLGLAVLLEQGPTAIADLAQQFRNLNPSLEEAAEQAAIFNDTLNLTRNALAGVGRRAFTPLLSETNQLLGSVGLLADEYANLVAQVEDARRTFEGQDIILNAEAYEDAKRAYDDAIEALTAYVRKLQEAKEGESEQAAQLRQSQLATAEYREEVKTLEQAFSDQATARKRALAEETSELRKARRDQQSIEQEFANLVRDITAVPDEDVSLGDVFSRINQGAAAVERGELGKAVELSREGADLLGKLKEEGTETTGTLKFLAQELQRVATAAAAGEVAQEETDVAKAQQAFDNIKQQAEILKETAPEAGTEYARAFLAAMTEEFQRTTIPAPQVAGPATDGPTIRRNGNSFSDGTDAGEVLRRTIDQQGVK